MSRESWFLREHPEDGSVTATCLKCRTVLKFDAEHTDTILSDPEWFLNCPCSDADVGHA